LWSTGRLPGWSRHPGFVGGLAAETALSAATAPLMMLNQALAVIAPFLGRDAGWRPQSRVAVRATNIEQYRPQLIFGLMLCITMTVSAGFAAWTLPVAVSLICAAPLAAALAHAPPRRTWLWRVLATPEDLRPPTIVMAARRATTDLGWRAAKLRMVAPTPAVTRTSEGADASVAV
jgi:membrane glycosyltransferase